MTTLEPDLLDVGTEMLRAAATLKGVGEHMIAAHRESLPITDLPLDDARRSIAAVLLTTSRYQRSTAPAGVFVPTLGENTC